MNLQNIPDEVLWVLTLPRYVGSDTYKKAEEIIAKYPEYFPWETKYNSIPKEVHQAYIKEKYPDKDEPIVCTGGISQMIKDEPFVYKEYTPEGIGEWFKQLEVITRDAKNAAIVQRKKDKKLWDKHYKKYNLEFRE